MEFIIIHVSYLKYDPEVTILLLMTILYNEADVIYGSKFRENNRVQYYLFGIVL
jgi:hypothetical protein